MHDPENLYLCFRPETKSTKPHAACRQYVFETTRELLKWLRSRKNSTESVWHTDSPPQHCALCVRITTALAKHEGTGT